MSHRGTPTPEHRAFPLDRILRIPEEVGFFVRTAIYGITVTVIYWYLTYEVAGTVLLGAIGIVSAVLALLLYRRRPKGAHGEVTDEAQPSGPNAVEGPFGDDPGLAPNPTLAPLEVGLGIMLALFAIPFGLWMAVVAVPPLAAGSIAWLRSVEEEQRWLLIADGEMPRQPGRPERPDEEEAAQPEAPGGPAPNRKRSRAGCRA